MMVVCGVVDFTEARRHGFVWDYPDYGLRAYVYSALLRDCGIVCGTLGKKLG